MPAIGPMDSPPLVTWEDIENPGNVVAMNMEEDTDVVEASA